MSDCPFCEKGGIPLYLFREAAAVRRGSPVAGLGAPFVKLNDDASDPWLVVGRVLRSGYVYLHDDVRRKWRAFAVAAGGYFYEFDPKLPAPPALDAVSFSCYRDPADVALASCITVEDTKAKPAGKVQIAFSDVAWTAATFKRMASAAERAKFMRTVDLTQRAQDNALPLEQVDTLVAEHQLDGNTGRRIYAWSPFSFGSKQLTGGYFKNLVDGHKAKNEARAKANLPPLSLHVDKGLVVKVRDVSGMLREVSRLTQFKANEFLTDQSRVRQIALSNAIAATEQTIKEQAWASELDGIKGSIEKARYGYTETAMAYSGVVAYVPPMPSLIPGLEARAADPAWRTKIQDDAWKRYTKKFKPAERTAFLEKLQTDAQTFDQQWLAPLATWHAWWLRVKLGNFLEGNFDPADWEQGFAYQQTVALCIENMAEHKPFNDTCEKLLAGDLTDKSNALMRALAVNNDEVIKKIKEAAAAPLDPRGLGSENVASAIKEGIASVNEPLSKLWAQGEGGFASAAAHLLTQMAGPLVHFMAPDVEALSIERRTVLLALGALSNEPLIKVTFAGNKKAFQEALVRRLIKASGQALSANEVNRAVAAQMRRMELERTVLKGEGKLSYFTVIDKSMAQSIDARLPPGATRAQRADALAQALRTPEDMEKAFNAFDKIGKAQIRLGVVAGILQIAAFTKAAADEGKAMQHEKTESLYKYWAALGAAVGSFTEVLGIAAGRATGLVLAGARGVQGAALALKGAAALKFLGRGLGAVAGVIVAFWDASHAWEEYQQGNAGMMTLYVLSAGVGLAVAFGALGWSLLLTAWLPVLFVVLVVVVVLIEVFKDNKLEDWLERTLWGTWRDEYKRNTPFESIEVEMEQFKLALEG
jgi:hypothetical protein